MNEMIRCQSEHIEPLAQLLTAAFLHDPLYEFAFPTEESRASLASREMEGLLRYGLLFGEIHAAPGLTGCTVWLPPGQTDFTEERIQESGMLNLMEQVGQEAEACLTRFNEMTEVVHRRIVPARHWYLLVLAVDPSFQGQGIGSRLLAPLLARADQDHLPIYLETTNLRNLAFYRKHGFETLFEEPLCPDGPMIWYMVRKTRAE